MTSVDDALDLVEQLLIGAQLMDGVVSFGEVCGISFVADVINAGVHCQDWSVGKHSLGLIQLLKSKS